MRSLLHHAGYFIEDHRLSSCVSVVVAHELCWFAACGILVPWPGIEPVSPAWEGGFVTPGSPGTSPHHFLSAHPSLVFLKTIRVQLNSTCEEPALRWCCWLMLWLCSHVHGRWQPLDSCHLAICTGKTQLDLRNAKMQKKKKKRVCVLESVKYCISFLGSQWSFLTGLLNSRYKHDTHFNLLSTL